ncbi:helix-turn-helix transcriptional regulator [Ignatzschineria indica]|uniref:helix-turn-helix transcriptional regulator n=1 Tax=Ignatzschineria indica TaxID=472583 RepID=UPI0036370C21
MELKDRLKQARNAKGYSQAKLGELVGVTQTAIQYIENGRNQGSTKIFEIARALDVSAEWLLYGKERCGYYDCRSIPLIEHNSNI